MCDYIGSLCCTPQVNSYPTEREFTAIGLGGDDFVKAMVVAVESVLQHPIAEVTMYIHLSELGLEQTCLLLDASHTGSCCSKCNLFTHN